MIFFWIDFGFVLEGADDSLIDVVQFVISRFYSSDSGDDLRVQLGGEWLRECLIEIEHVYTNLVPDITELDLIFE